MSVLATPQDAASAWPEPRPLPSGLAPVKPIEPEMLPDGLRDFVLDVGDRLQCPADYVAVSVMVAAGSVIGRKVGVRPQQSTPWTEAANLWGCIVGRPGVLKSPAMKAALAPLRRLDDAAADTNAAAVAVYQRDLAQTKAENEVRKSAQKSAARKSVGDGNVIHLDPALFSPLPEPPLAQRYLVNDTSYEKLGEIMQGNPNGVMIFRDELVSMLQPLDRSENATARGFYLAAWNGTDSYTFDRIGRGTVRVSACCLSILGATQPARWSSYLSDAVHGGAGDDGFAQRFGLLVWPDVDPNWEDVDREPSRPALARVTRLFQSLDALKPEAINAQRDEFDAMPFLRLDSEALMVFREWRETLERRLRTSTLHPALESHLAKYRGLGPKLAMICHLCSGGVGPVNGNAMFRALTWLEYLESHANRAYGSVLAAAVTDARMLIEKIRRGALPERFSERDVYRKEWRGLTDLARVRAGLELLVDHDWLGREQVQTGGRSTHVFTVNPKGLTA